jgi:hypothetical protein
LDEVLARQLLDHLLEQTGYARVSDAEFSKALTDPDLKATCDVSPTPEDDFAQEAARAVRFARRLGGEVSQASRRPQRRAGAPDRMMSPIAAPSWWEAESTRRLNEFLRERAMMRQDAGLFRLTPWHEASSEDEPAPRVDDVREMMGEPSDEALAGTGRFAGLRQVSRIEPLIERLELESHREVARIVRESRDPDVDYPDIDPDDFLEDEVFIEYPAKDWTPENPRTKSGFFVALGFTEGRNLKTSIQRIHNRSLWIASQAGISQAEALVWGLTDVPFVIPWISIAVEPHLWANEPWQSVTLRVGSTATTAKDVARAYQLAVRGQASRGGRVRAPRGPWRDRTVAFVNRQRRENRRATWDEMFDAFTVEYGEHPYGSMRSLQQAYYLGQRASERSTP